MTAERTVPSPGVPPRDHGFPPVSVVPPRGGRTGPRLPPAPSRPASPLPLLVADAAAVAPAVPVLTGARLDPLLVALLIGASLLLRPREVRGPVPGLLEELPAVSGRVAVAWLATAALWAAYRPEQALSASTVLTGTAVQAAAGCALRAAVHGRRRAALLRHPLAALVVGPVAGAQRVAAAVLRHPRCGVRPVGIVAEGPDGGDALPVLRTDEEVDRAVIQNGVRAVLAVGPSARAEHGPLLRALAGSGCVVWEVDADSAPYPARERLAGFSCRRLDLAPVRGGGIGKRLLDILVSGTLLLLVSPLLLVCAVTLRVTDGPGVVFRQERIGRDGKPFTLLKFRTHRPVDEHESATRWSVANEHEMRRFCRMLRRTSLDELLQLWNVLRGDMSLVGPRPERPYFVAQFSQTYPGYATRHRMRTGITGLAQVHGLRGDTSIEDRCRFDNAYIDDWSLWRDVCILLRTAATLVRPTGS
ncbi:exopolysaccharide biosynthesis polyprenyl glycosylphosphotransferase [Streptomyces capillispiralis]|uniref:Exopolysaccharide biosynthesis polyprenyl glycosylphosphotransferase n=1 Tax=Streptomyces capillispiralis TaxID=68182 RepID=A0A561TJT4_9ACTN|nr:exopolysaccharide biosynthesis polyprenyl glycosylphosphotransferase [Streptomyces capillispiralis]TWF87403.1 exopolysaccharide biosynthesis polyprenyl glycosylphosphotransferase [Streptomyces capillispiralis]GHH92673.1 transferase [Streptomyces capillispiralis]